jgi:hypothetical protein
MPARQLVLISSLRPSSKYRHTIHQEEAEAWLHGVLALWHPKLVAESVGPPSIGTHEEFETPVADALFVVPRTSYQYQSQHWQDEQRAAGALVVEAEPDHAQTWRNLSTALGTELLDSASHAFAGLGLGYFILEAYCDAQDHQNPLDKDSFYALVKEAAVTVSAEDRHRLLGQAAHLLQEAREVMQPSNLYQAITLSPTGEPADNELQQWLNANYSFTLTCSAEWLRQWKEAHPTLVEKIDGKLRDGSIDWWVGCERDQPDALLPMSAWLENLRQGLEAARRVRSAHLPQESSGASSAGDVRSDEWHGQITSHSTVENAGRRSFAGLATLPTLLHSFGVKRSLQFSADSGVWPHATNSLVAWRGPDSQLLEAVTRKPEPLEQAETAFHLGLLLHEAGTAEYVGWLHLGILRGPLVMPYWFECWAALHQLAPVFGHLGSLDVTVRDIPATEQFTPVSADDFQSDYLLELTGQADDPAQPDAISRFATAARQWRRWESLRTVQALRSVITPSANTLPVISPDADDKAIQEELTQWSHRLGSVSSQPGYLLLNPCSFSRQVRVNLPKATTLFPAPATASQKAEQGIDAILELPPFGYAWLPCSVEKGAKVRLPREVIATDHTLSNSHLIVEIDPATGSLRSLRDATKQIPRLGQQLVFAPGSTMHGTGIRISRNGHAVGEIITTGELRDAHGYPLAQFQQTFTLGATQKFVEVTIELKPTQPVVGYPWHAYFASRWAWRDPSARLSKSVHQTTMPVMQTRPETPGFIEIEGPSGRVALFSGGLPFWQRHGSRMLDSLLLVEGETATTFRFALSVDDELPHLTEQDWLTPVLVTPCNGPPAAGVATWLFHLDSPSVMLLDMQIDATTRKVTLRMLETFGYATDALLQCPRPPRAAHVVDSWGVEQQPLTVTEEGVQLRVGCHEFLQVRLEM